ncbi:NAD(P)-dependent oxidoreductase [Xanthobacter sp. V0B-10]|uniref:NAD-dependent epimerase/dehydratase family protein n=1 Tax=Xanthobacter albus TaxID=3119929 RepID=UPI00372AC2E7
MKLFVTGAGGFVGAALVRQALRAGHEVAALVRPGGNVDRLADADGRLEIVQADIRDAEAIAGLLAEVRPEVVVHVAWSGVSGAARFDRLQLTDNVEATCALMDGAIAAGVSKFVGIGSQGEYGLLEGRVAEDKLPEPTTLYGASKVAVLHLSRQLAAQAGMSFAWLRLFSTYGPDDNPRWLIPTLVEQMLDGARPKTTLGTQKWDYLFIDDTASGILAAAVTPGAQGVFNLGAGVAVPVRRVVETIRDLAAPDLELVFGEIPFRPDQIWHMEADIDRLVTATGWRPQVDLEAGLARTVEWHRARRAAAGQGAHA